MKKNKKQIDPKTQEIIDLLWRVDRHIRHLPRPLDPEADKLYDDVFEMAHRLQGTKDNVIDINFLSGDIIITHPYKK